MLLHLLIGARIGSKIVDATTSHGFLAAAAWPAIPFFVGLLVQANVSTEAAYYAAYATPFAMLAFALWRPSTSSVRIALLEGLFTWIGLAAMIFVGLLLFTLVEDGFVLTRKLLPPLLGMAAACLVIFGLGVLLGWSERREDRRAGRRRNADRPATAARPGDPITPEQERSA